MWLGVKRNDCPEPMQREAKEERAQDKGYAGDQRGSGSVFPLDKENNNNNAFLADIPRCKLN